MMIDDRSVVVVVTQLWAVMWNGSKKDCQIFTFPKIVADKSARHAFN